MKCDIIFMSVDKVYPMKVEVGSLTDARILHSV